MATCRRADALDKSPWRYDTDRGTGSADPAAAVALFVGGAAAEHLFTGRPGWNGTRATARSLAAQVRLG